ncbi:hypothetical protein [Pseudarthrobacter sulfonivorans]|uniref:hypothetical protein n=1 Tax=Pseudarthrobacter sulfonivorans TaxID=121292 RepID=UPI00285BE4A6|nr:hypothetical protein [Pseudarthrobacter sulfonivorans]MDR6413634.1 hypothetical protein [Pseudarthrobacter sulfonivorans]
MAADERDRILAELAHRARRDFQLRIDIFDREQSKRTAAIPAEQKKKLNLTEEHYRRHREFMATQRSVERDRLEQGIEFFGTFSSDVLAAFDDDLQHDGLFSQAHGISQHDGDPSFYKSWRGGTARFLSEFKYRHSGERYIRDFLTFRPSSSAVIHDAWTALGLQEPRGLCEVAAAQYSKRAINDFLLIAQALQSVMYNYQMQFVTSKGYAQGDEIAYRTKHLKHLTPKFAKYLLTRSPSDEVLARDLEKWPDDKFGLTLEGVTGQEFLTFLGRYRETSTTKA